MAIDFSKRPAGMSKREYAASILGGTKYQYSSSGKKKSSGSSSKSSYKSSGLDSSGIYKAKTYDYKDFLDTPRVETAYNSAKDTFLRQLTALKPRYEELYKQLEAEKAVAAEKEARLSEQERTQQKVNIAKRGIAVDTSNPFYTTEAGKLASEQELRSRETALQFANRRMDILNAQAADERDINTAIANLDLNKANTISNMITAAKTQAASMNQAEKEKEYRSKRDAIADAQWEKTFAYTKSKEAADRAFEIYKLAKSESRSNDNAYNSALSSLVAEAYSTTGKDDYSTPGIRENIARQLKAAFPKLESRIDKDIAKFFPDGWESQAMGNRISEKGKVTEKPVSAAELKQTEIALSGLRALDDVEKQAILRNRIQTIPEQLGLHVQLGAREYTASVNEVIDAISRLRSGAALTKEEQDFYRKQLPQPFDSDKTIKKKIKILREFLEGMANKKSNNSDPLGLGL